MPAESIVIFFSCDQTEGMVTDHPLNHISLEERSFMEYLKGFVSLRTGSDGYKESCPILADCYCRWNPGSPSSIYPEASGTP